ncbi:MAG: CHAT domain-containing protein [Actinomycetota bacterium]
MARDLQDPKRLHRLALSYLRHVPRHPEYADDVIGWLERAAANTSQASRPQILADLSAAYLIHAQVTDRPMSLALAHDAASRAVADPDAPASAHFNLALALEALYLADAAKTAWQRYVELDAGSPWAAEALDRWRALERTAWPDDEADSCDSVRAPANVVFFDSLTAMIDDLSSPQLKQLSTTARAIRRTTGDRLPEHAVRALQEAGQTVAPTGDPSSLAHMLEGLQQLGEGHSQYQRQRLTDARSTLEQAAEKLDGEGHPYALWARFYLACVSQQQNRLVHSLAQLQPLVAVAQEQQFTQLGAMVAWMQGLTQLRRGRPLEALSPYETAIRGFRQSGDVESLAAALGLSAELLFLLGQEAEAWKRLDAALELAPSITNPRRAAVVYSSAALLSRQIARHRTALVFQNEVVRVAEILDNPRVLHAAIRERGVQRAALGDFSGALADLERSLALAANIEDEGSRRGAEADLAALRALVEPAPLATTRALDDALEHYAAREIRTPIAAQTFRSRASRRESAGDLLGAARDLEAALGIDEYRLLNNQEPEPGQPLRQRARRRYSKTINLFLEAGDLDAAFRLTERCRRFAFHHRAASKTGSLGETLTRAALASHLPEGVTVLLYGLLDQEVLVWIVYRDGYALIRRPMDPEVLARQIQDFQRGLAQGDAEAVIAPAARRLGGLLLDPALEAAPTGNALVILTDERLGGLSFSALRPGRRPLIETTRLTHVTHLETLLAPLPLRSSITSDDAVVIVSEPQTADPEWLPIPSTRDAGATLARLYPRSVWLRGRVATPGAFLAAAEAASVIHFGGHAVSDPTHPNRSRLELAPLPATEPRTVDPPDGAVSPRELQDIELAGHPIVFLAACDTASLTGSPDEGLSSLAHAFEAAGARSVVGSLWTVDDDSAAYLSIAFHQALLRGLSSAEALREAQLAYLEDPDRRHPDPHGWAAFRAIGFDR